MILSIIQEQEWVGKETQLAYITNTQFTNLIQYLFNKRIESKRLQNCLQLKIKCMLISSMRTSLHYYKNMLIFLLRLENGNILNSLIQFI